MENVLYKTVQVSISQINVVLSGDWDWEPRCNSIFCSDVMDFPSDFEGTKGIIHPEDLVELKQKLFEPEGELLEIGFRIITSYGKIVPLKGSMISFVKQDYLDGDLVNVIYEKLVLEKESNALIEHLRIRETVLNLSEKMGEAGSFYINISSNSIYYSDNLYRIYGLQPQSLNNHLNTFSPFLHQDDREIVEDTMELAIKRELPLHIRYRIITVDGKEKSVLYIGQWTFNEKGEHVLVGYIRDETNQNNTESLVELMDQDIRYQKQIISSDESFVKIAHWSFNLLTLKVSFSEAYYRIFGLRPFSVPATLNSFINYVHPDDRAEVTEAIRKVRYEHTLPDLEYRIIRNDGKTKFIRQKGKLITHGNELLMVGIIEDITAIKIAEKKCRELKEYESLRSFSFSQAEETAHMGSWLLDPETGNSIWSDGIYILLGFKPQTVMLHQKRLLSFVYQEDRKKFSNEMDKVLKKQGETIIEFRILAVGITKLVKALFRMVKYEDKEYFSATFQDISKEFQLQERLKKGVQLAETLSKSIRDSIFITDNNNNIIFLNDEAERAFKIKKDQALQNNFFDILPFFKTDLIVGSFSKCLKGEEVSLSATQIFFRKEYYNISLTPLKNELGEVENILHVVHDATSEILLKQNQAERINFVEDLVDASVDCIIALDRNMNYVTWNKKCETNYRVAKADIIGKNVLEIFPRSSNSPAYEDFRMALRGETVYLPPKEILHGSAYDEVYLIPVKNAKNEVTAVLWIIHDLKMNHELGRAAGGEW